MFQAWIFMTCYQSTFSTANRMLNLVWSSLKNDFDDLYFNELHVPEATLMVFMVVALFVFLSEPWMLVSLNTDLSI